MLNEEIILNKIIEEINTAVRDKKNSEAIYNIFKKYSLFGYVVSEDTIFKWNDTNKNKSYTGSVHDLIIFMDEYYENRNKFSDIIPEKILQTPNSVERIQNRMAALIKERYTCYNWNIIIYGSSVPNNKTHNTYRLYTDLDGVRAFAELFSKEYEIKSVWYSEHSSDIIRIFYENEFTPEPDDKELKSDDTSEDSTNFKIFISQPMSGIPDEIVIQQRHHIFEDMKKRYGDSIQLIDSFIKNPDIVEKGAVAMLGDSISLMYNADLVVLAKGWQQARGCRVEKLVADLYNIPIVVSDV